MRNNRCPFIATISDEKVFGTKTIDIQVGNFYECMKDCIEKPLSLRLRFDDSYHLSFSDERLVFVAREEAKRAMHQFRQAVIAQAEMFFGEFYHYNLDSMADAILYCIKRGTK